MTHAMSQIMTEIKNKFRSLVEECLFEERGPLGRENMPIKAHGVLMMKMLQPEDRKRISQWNVEQEGNLVKFTFQFKLLSQLAVENLVELVDRNGGELRMYPGNYAVAVEMKFRAGQLKFV